MKTRSLYVDIKRYFFSDAICSQLSSWVVDRVKVNVSRALTRRHQIRDYLHSAHNVHVLYATLKTVSRACQPGPAGMLLCIGYRRLCNSGYSPVTWRR